MTKVLLIDDDLALAGMLADYLEGDGFAVTVVHDGDSAVREALSGHYEIATLDVMMPGLSGIEVLRRIRAGSSLPVLMLTARGDDMDRIVGLELGADDYVPKPCLPRELAARLRAILRRSAAAAVPAKELVVGPLRLRPGARRVDWDGRPVELTSSEYNLIEVLARNAGRVVSKDELSRQALGRPLERYDRSIDVHLSSIRHKLGCLPDGRSCIQTVFRQGYQMIAE